MDNKPQVRKGEKCPTCGRYYDRHVSVDGMILKNDQVLMILRNAGEETGKWALIGGYVEWNETVEEAILREVKEEVGITVNVKKLFGVYSDPKRSPNGEQTITIVFILETENEDFKLQYEEVKKVQWFPLSHLSENIAFDHREMIEEYKKTIQA
jgi:8-oxo-dGTP diphosphatase